jgi:hypothetical protein
MSASFLLVPTIVSLRNSVVNLLRTVVHRVLPNVPLVYLLRTQDGYALGGDNEPSMCTILVFLWVVNLPVSMPTNLPRGRDLGSSLFSFVSPVLNFRVSII